MFSFNFVFRFHQQRNCGNFCVKRPSQARNNSLLYSASWGNKKNCFSIFQIHPSTFLNTHFDSSLGSFLSIFTSPTLRITSKKAVSDGEDTLYTVLAVINLHMMNQTTFRRMFSDVYNFQWG